jgi:hypothetical protein
MSDEGSQIIKDEDKEIINAGWGIYFQYLRFQYVWVVIFFFSLPINALFTFLAL